LAQDINIIKRKMCKIAIYDHGWVLLNLPYCKKVLTAVAAAKRAATPGNKATTHKFYRSQSEHSV
jgi:hypothetical protein